jgi:autotransporter-associated beta strand protein
MSRGRAGLKKQSLRFSKITFIALGAFGGAAIFTPKAAISQTYTWRGSGSGWSNSSSWVNNTAPALPGGSGVTLVFPGSIGFGTSTNNFASPFTLGTLLLSVTGLNNLTFPDFTISGGTLAFLGAGGGPASLVFDNSASVALTSNLRLDSNLAVTGTGRGSLLLKGVISGANGIHIDQRSNRFGSDGGLIFLGNGATNGSGTANTFSGGVTLNSGNLVVQGTGALGTGTLTIAAPPAGGGGSSVTFVTDVANAVHLDGTMTVGRGESPDGFSSGSFGTPGPISLLSGSVSGSGGITVTAGNNLYYSGAGTFSGAVNLMGGSVNPSGQDYAAPGPFTTINAYGLTLLGPEGRISATSAINIGNHAVLTLVNAPPSGVGAGNLPDRVSDAAPLWLDGGRITFYGASGLPSSEQFGSLAVTGGAILTVSASTAAGSSSMLAFGPLSRPGGGAGTLFVRTTGAFGQQIGGGTLAPGRTGITFSGGLPTLADPLGPAGGQNIGIIPFVVTGVATLPAVTHAGTPSSLATYDSNGLTALDPNDAARFHIVSNPGGSLAAHVNNALNGLAASLSPLNGALTINSLVVSSGGTNANRPGGLTLTGASGTGADILTLYSGALVNGGFNNANRLNLRDLTLDFGGHTGYLYGGVTAFTGNSGLTGTGGLAVSHGTLDLTGLGSGAATGLQGGLFVNTNATVTFARNDQLGATGGALHLDGGTLQASGADARAGSQRTLTVGAAGGTLSAALPTDALTIEGPLAGKGDLIVTGNGTVTLAGTGSTFSGDLTAARGTLVLAGTWSAGAFGKTIVPIGGLVRFSDTANFPSGQIVLAGGGLQAATDNATLAASILLPGPYSSVMSVPVGMTATLSGSFTGPGSASVQGGGTLRLTGTNTLSGSFEVKQGAAVLTGTGGTFSGLSQAQVRWGGQLVLDNTGAVVSDRLNGTSILVDGGDLRVLGPIGTTATVTARPFTSGSGTVTVVPGTGGSLTLQSTFGYPLLYRGDRLGASTGSFSRILLSSPGLMGGIVPGASADDSATGLGVSLAFYDPTLGVRVGRPQDYTQSSILQNAAPTGTVTTANFRTSGAVSAVGTSNTVNSLTLAPGSTLALSSGSTLALASGTLFAEKGGGPTATVSGGTLMNGVTSNGTGAPLHLVTVGDLRIDSDIVTSTINHWDLHKRGAGTLTVGGTIRVANFGVLNVDEGTFALAPTGAFGSNGTAYPLINARVRGGATLDIGSAGNAIKSLALDSGAVLNLSTPPASGPALILQGNSAYGYLDGTITGTGILGFAPSSSTTFYLRGQNTFTGGVQTFGNASFELETASAFGSGPVTLGNTGNIRIRYAGAGPTAFVANDFIISNATGATTTFQVGQGSISSGDITEPRSQGPQSITLTGRLRGGGAGARLLLSPSSGYSLLRLSNETSDFRGTVAIGGVVALASDAALGNAANTLEFSGGSLLLEGNGIVFARPILLTQSGAIDTNGNDATFTGPITATAVGWRLTKTGDGTLRVSGVGPDLPGTATVSDGTLRIDGTFGSTSGTAGQTFPTILVSAGGTLSGSGAIRSNAAAVQDAVQLNAFGTVAPGVDGVNGGIGTLTVDQFTWNNGGVMTFDLSSAASDRLDIARFFNRGGVAAAGEGVYLFQFRDASQGAGLTAGTTYTLVTWGSSNVDTGFQPGDLSYAGLPPGLSGMFLYNANSLQFTLSASAVPEPGSLLFIVLSGLPVLILAGHLRNTSRVS